MIIGISIQDRVLLGVYNFFLGCLQPLRSSAAALNPEPKPEAKPNTMAIEPSLHLTRYRALNGWNRVRVQGLGFRRLLWYMRLFKGY